MSEDKTLVEVKHLKQYFDINMGMFKTKPLKAVDDISFTIKKGETLGLVGESGCGKTTAGRSILHLYKPTAGEVIFDGKKVDKSTMQEYRTKATMVFQDPYSSLNPRMTVADIIAEPLDIHKMYNSKKERQERVLELMNYVGLNSEHAARYAHEFSGGQRQRIGIARALAVNPEFIVCDEPVSALDVSIQAQILNLISDLQKEMGITFIYVTHDQEEALTMSDTVVVMNKGEIQQIGTPLDIYNEPKNAFVADFIGESNIIDGVMVEDKIVRMYGHNFLCLDKGFAKNEAVDVVVRPEDIDIVPVEQGQITGVVTDVTFKGMQYDIIVDFQGFKWLIQTTDHSPVGSTIGVKIDPDGFHIMKKSEYSGLYGDYSSYSEEYDELSADPEAGGQEDE